MAQVVSIGFSGSYGNTKMRRTTAFTLTGRVAAFIPYFVQGGEIYSLLKVCCNSPPGR
jgi:hypothetical protein